MDSILTETVAYTNLSAASILFITLCGFLLPMILVYPPVPPLRSEALRETHTKLGIEPSESNLRTQFSPDHGAQKSGPPRIQSLWVYPVKSCRGVELSKARVLPVGLMFDRMYTLAQLKSPFPVGLNSTDKEKNKHSWRFITIRQFPLMATVQTEVWLPDVAKQKRKGFRTNEAFVIMRFPWQEEGIKGTLSWIAAKLARGWKAQPEMEIMLPVDFPSPTEIKERGYTFEQMTIWNETITALNMERELPPELARYLGVSNKLGLFRVDPSRLREVTRCAPTKEVAGYQPVTGLQDAYPLHLLSLSSIQEFSKQVPKDGILRELDVRRFRANIITSGGEPYDEESWKNICLEPGSSSVADKCEFHVSCRTVRCRLPNVDPDTGVRHDSQPDKSLRKFRDVDEGAPKNGCLGMQLTPLFDNAEAGGDMENLIEVGMSVKVISRGAHLYIPQ